MTLYDHSFLSNERKEKESPTSNMDNRNKNFSFSYYIVGHKLVINPTNSDTSDVNFINSNNIRLCVQTSQDPPANFFACGTILADHYHPNSLRADI